MMLILERGITFGRTLPRMHPILTLAYRILALIMFQFTRVSEAQFPLATCLNFVQWLLSPIFLIFHGDI